MEPEKKNFGKRDAEIFVPYESNGGTILAIAGADFAVIAADTRLSSGYSIHSRNQDKLYELTPKTVVGSTGCLCDTIALVETLHRRIDEYAYTQMKIISTEAMAQLISITMYGKRFLPYNVSNIVAGLDKKGKGAVYCFDSIGHFQRHSLMAVGTAGPIIHPILDNYIGASLNNQLEEGFDDPFLSLELAQEIAEEAFVTANSRDIYTGDYFYVKSITAKGTAVKKTTIGKK